MYYPLYMHNIHYTYIRNMELIGSTPKKPFDDYKLLDAVNCLLLINAGCE